MNTNRPDCPTKEFSYLHLPTRRVPIELVIQHAIVEWGVAGRAGWEDVLRESVEGFEARQTIR